MNKAQKITDQMMSKDYFSQWLGIEPWKKGKAFAS